MALPVDGPCTPWCTWEQVLDCAGVDLSSITDEAQQTAHIDEASWVLFWLTERLYPGECEATRSLCRGCSTCRCSRCCCRPRDRIDLDSSYPVGEVSEVVIAGVVLDVNAYHVSDWRWLVRDDGESWPSCADLDDVDAFAAKWTFGRTVPVPLARAAAILTAEIAASCVPDLECNLPARYKTVTGLNREGAQFTIIDSFKMLDEGKTGVYRVDLALRAEKQSRRAKPAMSDPGQVDSRASRTG